MVNISISHSKFGGGLAVNYSLSEQFMHNLTIVQFSVVYCSMVQYSKVQWVTIVCYCAACCSASFTKVQYSVDCRVVN